MAVNPPRYGCHSFPINYLIKFFSFHGPCGDLGDKIILNGDIYPLPQRQGCFHQRLRRYESAFSSVTVSLISVCVVIGNLPATSDPINCWPSGFFAYRNRVSGERESNCRWYKTPFINFRISQIGGSFIVTGCREIPATASALIT